MPLLFCQEPLVAYRFFDSTASNIRLRPSECRGYCHAATSTLPFYDVAQLSLKVLKT